MNTHVNDNYLHLKRCFSKYIIISYNNICSKAASSTDLVFSSIHSFLSHCTMISKMLKGKDSDKPLKCIGDVLKIPVTSCIHDRTSRNSLEHYDERLKSWISAFGPDCNIGTYNIGPKSALSIPGLVFVSHYDPIQQVFTFINEDFDIAKIYNEVCRIKKAADDWVNGLQSGLVVPPLI